MDFEHTMEHIARAFEVTGVLIITIGGVLALIDGARNFTNADHFFKSVRRGFGRPLILGLEVLVAADIILTITIEPTLENAASLGVIVLVRVVLSFTLDIELDGMAPWRRAQTEALIEAQRPAA